MADVNTRGTRTGGGGGTTLMLGLLLVVVLVLVGWLLMRGGDDADVEVNVPQVEIPETPDVEVRTSTP